MPTFDPNDIILEKTTDLLLYDVLICRGHGRGGTSYNWIHGDIVAVIVGQLQYI